MIHLQGHLKGAHQTHFTCMDPVHTRYAIYTFTGVDAMGGDHMMLLLADIIQVQFHSTTMFSCQEIFGTASITVDVMLPRPPPPHLQ